MRMFPPCPSADTGTSDPRPLPVFGDRRRRTVGLLGGSFNPAHPGHRHISVAALRHLGLDEVWWLVSPQNPLKDADGMLPFAERLRLARIQAAHPQIRVTGIECDLKTRFTSATIRALKRRFPEISFVWLMGADNLIQIPRWDHWTRIFAAVPVAVFDRKPWSYKALSCLAAVRFGAFALPCRKAKCLAHACPPAWIFLPERRHPASASAIREKTGLDKLLKKRKK